MLEELTYMYLLVYLEKLIYSYLIQLFVALF